MRRIALAGALVAVGLLLHSGTLLAQGDQPKVEQPKGEPTNPPPGGGPGMGMRPGPGGGPGMGMGPGGGPGNPQDMFKMFVEKALALDLSAEQREKITGLKSEHDKKMKELMTPEMEKKLEDLREETQKADAAGDRDKVRELRRQRQVVFALVAQANRELLDGVRQELKPEQLQKIEASMMPPPPPPPAEILLKLIQDNAEKLKLSEEQSAQIKKLAEKYEASKPVMPDPAVAEAQKKVKELRDAKADKEEIKKASGELAKARGAIQEKLMKRNRECNTEVENILNKDQLAQLKELMRPAPLPPGAGRPRARRPAPAGEGPAGAGPAKEGPAKADGGEAK